MKYISTNCKSTFLCLNLFCFLTLFACWRETEVASVDVVNLELAMLSLSSVSKKLVVSISLDKTLLASPYRPPALSCCVRVPWRGIRPFPCLLLPIWLTLVTLDSVSSNSRMIESAVSAASSLETGPPWKLGGRVSPTPGPLSTPGSRVGYGVKTKIDKETSSNQILNHDLCN